MAAIYSLTGSAKLKRLNPEAHLRHLLDRITDHPSKAIDGLLPWKLNLILPRYAAALD